MNATTVSRFLHSATCIYIGLPYFFFFGGWLRTPYAVIAIGCLLVGLTLCIRDSRAYVNTRDTSEQPWTGRFLLLVLVPVILVALVTGVGGWGWQDADWLTQNSIFRDLINEPWPVVYDRPTEPLLLVYYTAFYLPAAVIGKFFGWETANHCLFIYYLAGLSLSALWVVKLTGVRRWWCVPLFLAFSGMDVLGAGLRTLYEYLMELPIREWINIEWWAGYGVAVFPSTMDLLAFVPRQALPAWLLTALILNDAREDRLHRTGLFYLAISTLWAPYVSIGLFPVVTVLMLRKYVQERQFLMYFSVTNIVGGLLALIMVGYFFCRFEPHVPAVDISGLYKETLTLTLFRRGNAFLLIYPLFVLLEFGILHALLYGYLSRRKSLLDRPLRLALITSTVVLSLLPWVNLGWNNDIVMRASIPMLFITMLVTIGVLNDMFPSSVQRVRQLRLAIVGVILIGAINAAIVVSRQANGIYEQGNLVVVPNQEQVMTLFELQEKRYNGIGFYQTGQYVGSLNAPFARFLLANPKSP